MLLSFLLSPALCALLPANKFDGLRHKNNGNDTWPTASSSANPLPHSISFVDITNLIEARGRIDCRCRMLQVGLDAGERVQLDGRPHPVQCLNGRDGKAQLRPRYVHYVIFLVEEGGFFMVVGWAITKREERIHTATVFAVIIRDIRRSEL